METATVSIPNISCGHCTMTIENELKELEGVKEVQGNVEDRSVTISWDSPASFHRIREKLAEINYPAKA